MVFEALQAKADPRGNRITLSWRFSDQSPLPEIRVMRRERSYPTAPNDGVLVFEGEDVGQVSDLGLHAERVYYYALFPIQPALLEGDPPRYKVNLKNRVSAMATGPYNFAGQLFDLLPAIYHRYDTALPLNPPENMSAIDKERGALRRFLDLPGAELDQFQSAAKSVLDLKNVAEVEGTLLPLLSQWMGWKTDHRLELDAQRNELRDTRSVYETIGLIPSVEATVKRILGWESRAKEFVHNVARSNQPEHYNLWARRQKDDGLWADPLSPLSLSKAFEGRPAAATDDEGQLWLFFHSERNGSWDIWFKTLSVFEIAPEAQETLSLAVVSFALQDYFEAAGYGLSLSSEIEIAEDEWLIKDREACEVYTVLREGAALNVYRWAPSERLTQSHTIDKHPTVVRKGNQLCLFWNRYDLETKRWQIVTQAREAGEWSTLQGFGDDANERKRPQAIVDHTDTLWLFWMEKNDSGWALKYKRREASVWNLSTAHRFPLDGDTDPRVEADLFVLFQPATSTPDNLPRVWVFWARKVSTGISKQSRWEIAYRVAHNIDPNAFDWVHAWSVATAEHQTVDFSSNPILLPFLTWYVNRPPDWSGIQTVRKTSVLQDDREPAALIDGAGVLRLFWSARRNQGWSVYSGEIDLLPLPQISAASLVTETPYSQRDPLPLLIAGRLWLLHHGNEHLSYGSSVYAATETNDFRYAGSTSVDSTNLAKCGLRGKYMDFQTYSYDTGKRGVPTDETWYAREAIGIYLSPDTEDPSLISAHRKLIDDILKDFLPIQARAVFIIEPTIYKDYIYTYDAPSLSPQIKIGELVFDGTIPEVILGAEDQVAVVEGGS